MYGAQTRSDKTDFAQKFENDVEMYGAQTMDEVKKNRLLV